MFILEFVYRLFPVHYFLYIRSRSSADRYVQQSWSQISRKGRDEGKLFFRPFSWVLARLNLTPIFSHPRKRWIATGYESTETAGDSSGFSTAHSQVRVGNLKTKTATCNYPEPSSLWWKGGWNISKKKRYNWKINRTFISPVKLKWICCKSSIYVRNLWLWVRFLIGTKIQLASSVRSWKKEIWCLHWFLSFFSVSRLSSSFCSWCQLVEFLLFT